jgi:hypothetical protein
MYIYIRAMLSALETSAFPSYPHAKDDQEELGARGDSIIQNLLIPKSRIYQNPGRS